MFIEKSKQCIIISTEKVNSVLSHLLKNENSSMLCPSAFVELCCRVWILFNNNASDTTNILQHDSFSTHIRGEPLAYKFEPSHILSSQKHYLHQAMASRSKPSKSESKAPKSRSNKSDTWLSNRRLIPSWDEWPLCHCRRPATIAI